MITREEQEKPRTKIEYVKVNNFNDKTLASIFSNEDIYYMVSNSHDSNGTRYKQVTTIDELACAVHVYRKVETEIDLEQEQVEEVSQFIADNSNLSSRELTEGLQLMGFLVDVRNQ